MNPKEVMVIHIVSFRIKIQCLPEILKENFAHFTQKKKLNNKKQKKLNKK